MFFLLLSLGHLLLVVLVTLVLLLLLSLSVLLAVPFMVCVTDGPTSPSVTGTSFTVAFVTGLICYCWFYFCYYLLLIEL